MRTKSLLAMIAVGLTAMAMALVVPAWHVMAGV